MVNCKHEKGNKRGNDIIYLSLYQQLYTSYIFKRLNIYTIDYTRSRLLDFYIYIYMIVLIILTLTILQTCIALMNYSIVYRCPLFLS